MVLKSRQDERHAFVDLDYDVAKEGDMEVYFSVKWLSSSISVDLMGILANAWNLLCFSGSTYKDCKIHEKGRALVPKDQQHEATRSSGQEAYLR
ncbi:hypothetical protein Nepgr_031212 [Nepenthes gracilis]|uniref:Uncharacterized protein n=1 Tax=Nepenthes gracilis TaxID=150966 RepID=A0AAD3Y6U6_NEPGR|nr:hypothetical protein Nepgr_031212 [Nepenthes gracilis]